MNTSEKIDMRIIRTQNNLKNSFYELRKTLPLEKIKVRDLCRQAMINPSTFYDHYLDIYDLSNQLEDRLIDECFSNFVGKELLLLDTKSFLSGIYETIQAHRQMFFTLFNERFEIMYRKMEKYLEDYYCNLYSKKYDSVLISFIISGTMHCMEELENSNSKDLEEVLDKVNEIINKLV